MHKTAAKVLPAEEELPAPVAVPWGRFGWLGWPPQQRRHWVMAPPTMNYGEAEEWAQRWAARQGRAPQVMYLPNGETLVRLARRGHGRR